MRGRHITLSVPITSRHSLYYTEIYNTQDRERKLFLINVLLLRDRRRYFEKLEQEKFVGAVTDSSLLGEIFAILCRLRKNKNEKSCFIDSKTFYNTFRILSQNFTV